MRLNERNQILNILDTVQEMFTHIRTVKEEGQIASFTLQCAETIERVHQYLESSGNQIESVVTSGLIRLLQQCEIILQADGEDRKKALKKSIRMTEDAKYIIRTQLPVKWQAVFLPYKASMWTALESIWKAADQDPDCEAIVMPIPYRQLDGRGIPIKLCYEGKQFPSYVPITDYRDYHIDQEKPEMIFIHNPYDDKNTVTRVLESFYSYRLREHTQCLVFSPYFTYSYYTKGVTDLWFSLPAMYQADKIIVQSPKVKKVFVKNYGFPERQFIAEGSPKIDAIIQKLRDPVPMPEEWKDKLENKKKIFLLNTHMLYFIESANYVAEHPGEVDYGIQKHKEIVQAFEAHPEYGLIWRPHPLLRSVMNEHYAANDRYREGIDFVDELEQILTERSNSVIDRNGDYIPAFFWSDALITTASSLTQEYMVTGKPVLMLTDRPLKTEDQNAFVSFRCNYFTGAPEHLSILDFLEQISSGFDPKKEERVQSIHAAFTNLKGTAGEKIYQTICQEIQR